MCSFAQGAVAAASWFDYFSVQLQGLVPLLQLDDQRNQILGCFDSIFGESLAAPCEQPPAKFSRINFDGLPIQYSVSLSGTHSSLQFLGEAGSSDATNLERLRLTRYKISVLLKLLKITTDHEEILTLIDQLAPEADPDLIADQAGALWLSPTFSRAHAGKLTIYFNNGWGAQRDKIRRIGQLTAYVAERPELPELLELTRDVMEPLGTSLTLSADKRPHARMYLRAFGKEVGFYHDLVKRLTAAPFQNLFQRFLETLLREESHLPTQSVVCSVGLDRATNPDFKIELCCHCALASDVEAKARCLAWLQSLCFDPEPYLILLDQISGGGINERRCESHVYVALGTKDNQPYSSIYLKPHIPTFDAGH